MKTAFLIGAIALVSACATPALADFTPTPSQLEGVKYLRTAFGKFEDGKTCRIKEYLPFKGQFGYSTMLTQTTALPKRDHALILLPAPPSTAKPLSIGLFEPLGDEPGSNKQRMVVTGVDNGKNDPRTWWFIDPFVNSIPIPDEIKDRGVNVIVNAMGFSNPGNDLTKRADISSSGRWVHISLPDDAISVCDTYASACPCVATRPITKAGKK